MRNVDKTGVDSGTDAQRLTGNSPRCSSIPIGQTEIDRILAKGAERARAIAAPILHRTYDIVGMVQGSAPL